MHALDLKICYAIKKESAEAQVAIDGLHSEVGKVCERSVTAEGAANAATAALAEAENAQAMAESTGRAAVGEVRELKMRLDRFAVCASVCGSEPGLPRARTARPVTHIGPVL